MPPKNKGNKITKMVMNNNQAKLKYTTSCIKTMTESLPRQTFSSILPIYFETVLTDNDNDNNNNNNYHNSDNHKKKNTSKSKKLTGNNSHKYKNNNQTLSSSSLSSHDPIILHRHFYNIFPVHPNIQVSCVFCEGLIPSGELKHYIEQPHARRRYTPMCENCYGKV